MGFKRFRVDEGNPFADLFHEWAGLCDPWATRFNLQRDENVHVAVVFVLVALGYYYRMEDRTRSAKTNY